MKVACLLPWISVHIDSFGRITPCSPETSRVTLGHGDAEGVAAAWNGVEAANVRHCMVSRQWPKTCRKSCPVLQQPPIDLLLGTPPAPGHKGIGPVSLDDATWNELRQGVLRDPDGAAPSPLMLTIEEGEHDFVGVDLSFDRLQLLRLVLREQSPFGPALVALVDRIRRGAPRALLIEIEAHLDSFDAATRARCEALVPRQVALVTRGLADSGAHAGAMSNLRRLGSSKLAARAMLVLEITRSAIAAIPSFFAVVREHGLQTRLRRPRALLGSEDPFAVRAYADLKRLAVILERCRRSHADVWQAEDRARWEAEPLLARIAQPEPAAYLVVASEAPTPPREPQLASRRGA